ncbi:MAG: hypothetical protein ACOCUU_02315 [Nanoarchaeota archaeon]
MFKITKEEIIGRFFQIVFILMALAIMYFGGLKFFIVSIIFFGSGGAFEFLIMNYFYSKPKKNLSKKDKNATKISNAFLWVHRNIDFIKRYNTTIYDFNKIGSLVCALSYFIILVYVAIAFLLYKQFSYYGFLIYLIPIISNSYSFFRNHYFISD